MFSANTSAVYSCGVNTGSLVGNVDLGDGNDTFDTVDGRVSGPVYRREGNDVHRTDSAIVEIPTDGGDRLDGGNGVADFEVQLATLATISVNDILL